jgi:FtsH-binding integral membrane protein
MSDNRNNYTNQSSNVNPYASPYSVAAQSVDVRAEFIRKTYMHLAGAIAAFAFLEYLFLQSEVMTDLAQTMLSSGSGWLIVIVAFMAVSVIANKWAMSNTSIQKQYMGLGLYVVAEALIFLPMIYMAANYFPGQALIAKAGFMTGALVAGITLVAFTTKKDFSFLGGFLRIGGFVILGLIALSFIPGVNLNLGTWFSAAMIAFASISILYSTSNIIHQYNTNQYVAASLGLFASVALLFWYILRILMSFASNE